MLEFLDFYSKSMNLNRKMISNILFIAALALVIYPPSRAWLMRQFAFSPSIENVEDRAKLTNYNWQLKGLNTADLDFETTKNKVIIVNFWATWCPPCIAEMPSLQDLYNDYKDQVIFVFVTQEGSDKVIPFIEKNKYDLPIYNMLSQEPSLLTTRSIPATYLIDKNGAIVINKTGAANWNSAKVRSQLDDLIKK